LRSFRQTFAFGQTELIQVKQRFDEPIFAEGPTMRASLIRASVAGALVIIAVQQTRAEQRQDRPVTTVHRSTSITTIQWSPNSQTQTDSTRSPKSTSAAAPGDTTSKSPAAATRQVNPNAVTLGRSTNSTEPFIEVALRPTNQQLQNPSGGYHLTHLGFSQPASIAPNNYFGPEFNSWNNLRVPAGNLDAFESFNRFQPDMNSSGYFSTNTWLGPINSDWSGLSSSSVIPNDLGGWSYRP
jgi:hypothetical protein